MTVAVTLVDFEDSFSFNLADEFERRGAQLEVVRGHLAADRVLARACRHPAPRLLLLSPGPGTPQDAGCALALCRDAPIPLLGVCLGMQALVVAHGGRVAAAGELIHGQRRELTHDGTGMFAGLPSPLSVGRYHSLAARELPPCLRVTAWCGALPMAVEHRERPQWGVQFHPESILTPCGGELLARVLAWAAHCDAPGEVF
jgi:anthranilate synthase component 2